MSPAESSPFETATFDHVAVSVSNLDAMTLFYETVFGFVVEGRASFPSLGIRTALLGLPSGARIELAEATDATGSRSPSGPADATDATGSRSPSGPADAAKRHGYYHWALEVADLEAACSAASDAGALIAVPPSDAAREGMRYAYLSDPEGNLIELIAFR